MTPVTRIFPLIALSLISVAGVALAGQAEFCTAFQRGYVTGIKQASGWSADIAPPACPAQPAKLVNDPQSDYEHGYVVGFQEGLRSGQK
jgi:hypothetical protein